MYLVLKFAIMPPCGFSDIRNTPSGFNYNFVWHVLASIAYYFLTMFIPEVATILEQNAETRNFRRCLVLKGELYYIKT